MRNLRSAAEAKLVKAQALPPDQTEADPRHLQHELQVHQVELELQNQELRLAQVEATAALERYTDLFDFAPVGYFNLGGDGTILLVNLTGAKFIGLERARLIGRRLSVFVADEYRRTFSDFLTQAFATGTKQTCELTLAAEDRPPLIVHLEATVTADGKACRTAMTDITERKRAEQALLANATFTDDVLNSLTAHVVVLDEKGTIIAANQAWRHFAWENGSSTDYLGQNYLTVCHQSARHDQTNGAAQAEAGIRAILDGKQAHFTLEYSCDSPTEMRWFRLRVTSLSGEQHGVVISHHNISEARKAELVVQESVAALQASRRQFKALFDHAGVGVALVDVSTNKLVQVNQRYCDITGYSASELAQLTFADITHSEGTGYDPEMMAKLKAGTLREHTWEKRYLRKDHSEICVSITASAMWQPGDAPDLFIGVVQDITKSKLLEEQFRQAQKMEAVGTLAGGIAHDFNNILAAIHGYTELSLMMLAENTAVREYLQAVLKSAGRATALVRQILAFSRQQETVRLPIALGPIVAECISLLRATIPTTIEFKTLLAPDAPLVLADVTQIHQILMNLGTNAWHAMKDHQGRLQITLERRVVDAAQAAKQTRLHRGIYALITVSDNGCGMDRTTVQRIFEPFFTTKPIGEGTGLGLAVVHGIMDHHDGAITLESTPGKGTVFQLYFPKAIGRRVAPPVTERSAPKGHGEKLLVVDDENLLAQMTQLALTELGYTVTATTKPADAIAMVRTDPQRFALVLTDQTMPGMTGLVLATQLQAIRPGLPVILTTGYIASLTHEQMQAAGIRQILPKPASLHAMATAIQSALSSSTES